MATTGDNNIKRNKPVSEKQILYVFPRSQHLDFYIVL